MHVRRLSWASTLRLPRSSFPPRAIPEDRPRYLKRCTDDLYAWQKAVPRANANFTLHDGPPYANGNLHIGHALNKILKDITCRVQLLKGRRVNYVPGWDCHGLPIEVMALQRHTKSEMGGSADQLGAVEIRKAALQLALETVETQKAGFREWAVMADWENAWTSLDADFELRQLLVFESMLKQGLIYRKFKPVYWSPSSHTALAEAELEYAPDHESVAAYVKFPMTQLPDEIQNVVGNETTHAVIWTTTPWTLLSNKGIAVHEKLTYAIVHSQEHGLLIIGETRIDELSKICKEDLSTKCLATFRGSAFLPAAYRHPLTQDSRMPIFHGDFVSADSGSGLVHVAPGHGMEDYKLCLLHGIQPFAPVDDHGRFTGDAYPEHPNILSGKEVLTDGNRAVLEMLEDKDMLIASNKYKHSYPYDWRSKQPVIIRATQQWFADVGEIQELVLKAIEGVSFIPEGGKERLQSFIRTRSEWCISRQRAWGVPIPALVKHDTGEAVLTPESVNHIIKTIEERGIDAWWTDDEFEPIWVVPQLRENGKYRRSRDTMDVWFDSGTSWTHMSKDPENKTRVADIFLEGTDQHRGWFQSSMLTRIAYDAAKQDTAPRAPYKTLVTHGFTLDHEGKKMSKSLGNVISPTEIMQGTLLPPLKRKIKGQGPGDMSVQYDGMGADALRLWVAGCDYTHDVAVGPEVLKAVNSGLSKLRVTFRLLTGLLDTHTSSRTTPFDALGLNDQLALISLQKLEQVVEEMFSSYEYHRAVVAISQYINAEFSATYIEGIKDRMYADATASLSRVHAQIVLWEIFQRLTRILSPITPLLVEEACDHLPSQLRDFHPVKAALGVSSVTGPWKNKWLETNLVHIQNISASVKAAQEQARHAKKMGSSLQSYVVLGLSDRHPLLEYGKDPQSPGSDLSVMFESFLVVSKVTIGTPNYQYLPPHDSWHYSTNCETLGHRATITVYEPSERKCARCWKFTAQSVDEGEDSLCGRCISVIATLDPSSTKNLLEESPMLASIINQAREENTPPTLERHCNNI